MKIPSSQRQPLNKINGGGKGMGEFSVIFQKKFKWEGLYLVRWCDRGITVFLQINTQISHGLTQKMWSISCTCVFKLGCKGYCLWTNLHSVKASCFQSRFFSLLKVFVCIDFWGKKKKKNCCCGLQSNIYLQSREFHLCCEILNLILATQLFS